MGEEQQAENMINFNWFSSFLKERGRNFCRNHLMRRPGFDLHGVQQVTPSFKTLLFERGPKPTGSLFPEIKSLRTGTSTRKRARVKNNYRC